MSEWVAIPGETPIDPSGLLDSTIGTRFQLNIAELNNIQEVSFKYLLGELSPAVAPFDYVWALELHKEMFGKVWVWAGKLRKKDLNIGLPYQQVETRLYDLFQNLPYWNAMPLMEQAARLHHEAVVIHPFENGNGRWSRMLANIWLKRHGSPPTVWPEETILGESIIRQEYLQALRAADQNNFAPLIALHTQYSTPGC